MTKLFYLLKRVTPFEYALALGTWIAIFLKCTSVIDWPWLWILFPACMWGVACLVILLVCLGHLANAYLKNRRKDVDASN